MTTLRLPLCLVRWTNLARWTNLSHTTATCGILLLAVHWYGAIPVATGQDTASELSQANKLLKAYVEKPDTSFQWEVRQTSRLGNCEVVRFHLVSQTWKSDPWKHILFVLYPDDIKADCDSAILLIGGGSWKREWGEKGPDEFQTPSEALLLSSMASSLGVPTAILLHVPHQPLLGGKREDAIIAETFQRFLRGEGDDWPLLMPMVKSASRAMDVVSQHAKQSKGRDISKFTLTGASKRGWTTWLTSAVDPRVDSLAPMVIDMLNMSRQMKHQVASFGQFSEQIDDYTDLQLQKYIDTPRGQMLQQIVDPYQYRDQLTQPKLLIFGTNDRYWPLDACGLYWQELQDPKYLLYVPNNGHGIRDYSRVAGSLIALHHSRNGGPELPALTWQFEQNEDQQIKLSVQSDRQPTTAQAWVATAKTRDFRDANWTAIQMPRNGSEGHHYEQAVPAPKSGFLALFAECIYDAQPLPAYFSTNVQIFEQN